MTDYEGNIVSITEGLGLTVGLRASFFQYSDDNSMTNINIQEIIPDLLTNDFLDNLETDGAEMYLDTRKILERVELETLN